jgi:hypothetical protein
VGWTEVEKECPGESKRRPLSAKMAENRTAMRSSPQGQSGLALGGRSIIDQTEPGLC